MTIILGQELSSETGDKANILMLGHYHCGGALATSYATSEFRVKNPQAKTFALRLERDNISTTFADMRFTVIAYKNRKS